MTSWHRTALLVSALLVTSCSSMPTAQPSTSTGVTATDDRATTTPQAQSGLDAATTPPPEPEPEPEPELQPLVVGAQALAEDEFVVLDGQRVGLIANHTARVGDHHLVDLLHDAASVDLVAVFAPEHGIRGSGDAGEALADGVDPSTGVPVYSIYGETKKPTPAMLDGIDVLVYDIQDVGTRCYTYISTLGLAMQAAAEAGIAMVVLDRPNPNAGPSAGPLLEPAQRSFIGQYEIPMTYGLTVGELARAIRGEAWIDGVSDLDLTVVELSGWEPNQHWNDLEPQVTWVAPSPGLPTADSARLYPGTVLFEATTLTWGRGTSAPFEQVGAPWLEAEPIVARLNELAATTPELAGATFQATTFTPERLPYMTSDPAFSGVTVPAVRVLIDEPDKIEPVALGVYLLAEILRSAPDRQIIDRTATFDLLAGNTALRSALDAGHDPADIVASWADSSRAFDELVTQYQLYARDTG